MRRFVHIALWALMIHMVATADPTQLESLSQEQAETLASRKGNLALNKLKVLSREAAVALAKHEGELSLNGLTQLSPDAAIALAGHKAVPNFGRADLTLDGITTLSAETAEALAKHQGALCLNSLQYLKSIPLAHKLAAQWGELHLNVLELMPKIATELARNDGVFEDRSRPGVVTRRGDLAPSILRLDKLQKLSPEAAAALATHQGILVLNGLITLEEATAKELAKRRGGRANPTRLGTALILNGLTSLSQKSAEALADYPGELVLTAVQELSPETAAALARHKGRLYLTCLKSLSPQAREALKKHPNAHLPPEIARG